MRKIILVTLLFAVCNLSAQSLTNYYELAAKNNPELKAKYKEFEASLQKIPQVSSLPDPNFSLGYFISPVETRLGPQNMKFSLTQMFPWFGTLKAQKNVAALLADSKYQAFLNTKNQLFFQVASAYYPLYELLNLKGIEQENIKILESYKKIASAKFENGKGSLVDVLRVDIMVKEAQTNLSILEKKEPALTAWFNSILNRKYDEKIDVIKEITLVELPLEYRKDSIVTNPLLLEIDLKKQAADANIIAVKKQGLPKLGVGLDYVFVGTGMNNFSDSGKDAIMPMVTLSLPIFRTKYNAANAEAKLMQESYWYQKEAAENKLNGSYYKMTFELEKEQELLKLYTNQVTTLSKSLNLLLAYYSNANKDFEEVLRMQQELLKYKKLTLASTSAFYVKLAELDYLTAKQF
ncbi:TolC family protein [Flavobacterium frigoris]|uniref:Heavy metal RND efflux outer membrane protein, CzcC family n=1 Tax=Flavobacterium frigoris (strain PS1) TaxID=1086011 RepID=H7FWK4_FLAFP|nr:TolC family protein [Flavobacterium frigoris]EIA07115.1 heavy metal RND efflux outer membrane protein, CzcC family [Flavobacterium frigoris PS1]